MPYPSYDVLKKEDAEEEPYLLFTISDSEGPVVRKIRQPIKAGVHRVVWDFRTSPPGPIALEPPPHRAPWDEPDQGYMVTPGSYQVAMCRVQEGQITVLGSPRMVMCEPLQAGSIPPADRQALNDFNQKVAALSRAISAADAHRGHLNDMLPYLEAAAMSVRDLDGNQLAEVSSIRAGLKKVKEELVGDNILTRYEGEARLSLKGRTDLIIGSLWNTTSGPTGTYERAYEEAHATFGAVLSELRDLHQRTQALEDQLERQGAPVHTGTDAGVGGHELGASGKHLDGDPAVQPRVSPQVNQTHPTAADLALDRVGTDPFRRDLGPVGCARPAPARQGLIGHPVAV